MIKRKLALLGTAVAVSLLMTVPAFAGLTPKIQTLHRTHRIHRAYRKRRQKRIQAM